MVKVPNPNVLYSQRDIYAESNYHRKIAGVVGLKCYAPKFLGETCFGVSPVIKQEYVN